jgi:F-type H+-transporting ATPase subunit gamma
MIPCSSPSIALSLESERPENCLCLRSLFKACAESLTSENASRLAAMQRAEKNIDSLLTNLNRTFYRLRQSSTDEELFDVIAGFNALARKEP